MSKILLNPGPTNTREETKLAQQVGSDVCHRTDDFKNILNETKVLLLDMFGSESFNITLLGGSGTVGMEAMISSLVDDSIIVINAGVYGQRAVDMMNVYGIDHKEICVTSAEQLKPNKEYKTVYFVENETTTGEHFSLEKMTELYPNAKFYIDTTSSFGASDYKKFHGVILGMSFCGNKCLQSTPGLGIVIWNKKIQYKERSYYCNLSRYMGKDLPFTLPVQSVSALNATLKVTSNQKNLFDDRRDRLIEDFSKMNIDCINQSPSNSIIGFKHPTMSYEHLKDFLYDRDIVIYAGIKGIDNSFRVSTMSVLFDESYDMIIRSFYDSCLL